METPIKVKARNKNGVTTIRALMSHPMSVEKKDKKSGKVTPAHFIQTVTCEHNGKVVLTAEWGAAVSANPYLSFKFKGANAGDSIKLSWVDNKDKKATVNAKIK
ncbi:MAG: thiosulfate oxidation carrier complex protein SoxZ [Gammaproteobacteria bacterium]|nr:thiosulfate oxidation carrier complex protein SoxZ [Gammaproteobacteria bacterium]